MTISPSINSKNQGLTSSPRTIAGPTNTMSKIIAAIFAKWFDLRSNFLLNLRGRRNDYRRFALRRHAFELLQPVP
jgi:hypothetical protein